MACFHRTGGGKRKYQRFAGCQSAHFLSHGRTVRRLGLLPCLCLLPPPTRARLPQSHHYSLPPMLPASLAPDDDAEDANAAPTNEADASLCCVCFMEPETVRIAGSACNHGLCDSCASHSLQAILDADQVSVASAVGWGGVGGWRRERERPVGWMLTMPSRAHPPLVTRPSWRRLFCVSFPPNAPGVRRQRLLARRWGAMARWSAA